MSDYKINNQIFSNKFLDSINLFLIDETKDWAESHPKTVKHVENFNLINQTIIDFKSLFCERFSFKTVEQAPIFIDSEFQKLKQRTNESLFTYYKKTKNIM